MVGIIVGGVGRVWFGLETLPGEICGSGNDFRKGFPFLVIVVPDGCRMWKLYTDISNRPSVSIWFDKFRIVLFAHFLVY
jgi:hypothetical protein